MIHALSSFKLHKTLKKLKSWTLDNCESDDVIILGKDAKSELFIMIFENIIIWTSCSNQKTALHTIIQTDLQLGKHK